MSVKMNLSFFRSLLDNMKHISESNFKEGDRNVIDIVEQIYWIIPDKRESKRFLMECLTRFKKNELFYKPNAWQYSHNILGNILREKYAKEVNKNWVKTISLIMQNKVSLNISDKQSLDDFYV